MALKKPSIEMTENGFLLSGDIHKDTVSQLPSSLDWDDQHSVIDLSETGRSDSAAVAMFLSWIRHAGNTVQLQFSNVPENLQSLFRLYGVDSLIRQV